MTSDKLILIKRLVGVELLRIVNQKIPKTKKFQANQFKKLVHRKRKKNKFIIKYEYPKLWNETLPILRPSELFEKTTNRPSLGQKSSLALKPSNFLLQLECYRNKHYSKNSNNE